MTTTTDMRSIVDCALPTRNRRSGGDEADGKLKIEPIAEGSSFRWQG